MREEGSAVSAAPAARSADWPELERPLTPLRLFGRRTAALCLAEVSRMRHDRTELYLRAIQPALWLLIFGETFSHIHAIPTGSVPYLDFLAPGIMAQSALFISIFYGIQIIWDRDAGILTKLMTTPTPRSALVTGKAFAAGVRATAQVVVVLVLAALLGVTFDWNPLHILLSVLAVVLGSAFFTTLSVSIAGLVLTRDRLMGIGQAITMPLFFASNALYPVALMPGWVRWVALINPLSYEVNALRALLLGLPGNLWLDFGVLTFAAVLGVTVASSLLGRLAR
jgi:ABC-2 type transport system permease protein